MFFVNNGSRCGSKLPVFFILLVWLIFSYPYFLQNKIPYPSTYQVNHFFPWSAYEKYWGPVKNGAMPDITDQIYPWRHFTIETWKKAQIPFWNPNSFSGNPHLANYQSAVFSPLNLLFFIFPFVDAWSLLILLQPLLAGIFTYLFLRELKVGREGSVLGSTVFMFCGFMVVWMAYGTLSYAILFLPLSLFAIERWFNKKSKLPLIILTLSIPLSFFSGHFQTSLYFFAFTFSYLIFKVLNNRKNYTPIVAAFILGILISLIQIIPSIQFYLESTRSGVFLNQGGIPISYLVNLFAPDFFGNPVTRNDWFGTYAEWASFVGIIPLVLSLLAFNIKNKAAVYFFVFGLITLTLAVDSPLQRFMTDLQIPVISTSNPTRIIVLLSFLLSILAGFGFDRLRNLELKFISKRVIPLVLLFALIWFSLIFLNFIPEDKQIIAQRNFILPTLLLGLFLAIVYFAIVGKQKILLFLILFLVAFDSLRFAQKWMPFDPEELVFPDTSVVQGIRENIGNGRIFGNFGANIDTYYGFPGIEGYDPLYIERYGEFIRSANEGEFKEPERSVVHLSRRSEFADRVLDLLGVSLIFHPVADTNQSWAYPVWENPEKYSVVWEDEKFQLFKNNTALPRAKLFYGYEVIEKRESIISRLYSEDFDFRNTLILEDEPNISELITQKSEFGEGKVEILLYEPNSVQIKVETKSPALLFLSDNYYPGWKARVSGEETKIYRADYTFRAVEVPEGESLVEFSYKPFSSKYFASKDEIDRIRR